MVARYIYEDSSLVGGIKAAGDAAAAAGKRISNISARGIGNGIVNGVTATGEVIGDAARSAGRAAFYRKVPNVGGAADALFEAKEALDAAKRAGDDTKHLTKNLTKAAREYHDIAGEYNRMNGRLGASIGHSLERFGLKSTPTHIPDDIFAHANAVTGAGRANWFERVLSKPFRVFPRAVPLALGALGIAGIASWLSGRQEEKTQQAVMRDAMEAQMLAQSAMRNPYMNSTTPEDYALLQERSRTSGNGQSLAEKVRPPAPAAGQQPA